MNSTIDKDIEFKRFSKNRIFESAVEESLYRLYSKARTHAVAKGDRLIHQGEQGDHFFVIRDGQCSVKIEKDGVAHLIGSLGPGDIVGEMAVLTGEPRLANVDAVSDMTCWKITSEAFDRTCEDYPQLRDFLTRLVAERLSGALLGGDRAVGKYLVGKTIGQGGWSVVYRGSHSNLDMPVAIKMLKHAIAMDPAFVEQFRQEARTVARLNHENIVKVYDVEELYRTFFIIMELVEGESLEARLQKPKKMSLYEKLDILTQTCSGLVHAHSNKIIHKDVKPSNILIRNDGKVKLVDFGFASDTGVKDHVVRGSVSYIAPEQIKREPVDERTDVYSVGIMAYEAFTGIKPCTATKRGEIVCWHLEQDLKDPCEVNSDLPEDLRAFVMKATRRAPKNRYQNCSQALNDLISVARRLGIEPTGNDSAKINMMNLFLLYRQEQQQIIQRIVKDFSRELEKVGARLRGTDFKDILD